MLMQATTPDILPATDDVIGLYEQEEAERASDCHIMELSYRVEQLHGAWEKLLAYDAEGSRAGRGQQLYEELTSARTQLRAELAAHRELYGEAGLARMAHGGAHGATLASPSP